MFASTALILMTKYPAAGSVKTRLMPALSAEQAAAVHRLFLLHGIRRLMLLQPASLILCFDPAERENDFRRLLEASGVDPGAVGWLPQGAGDLGQRMARAHAALAGRHDRVVLLGVDSPDLPADHLQHASRLLRQADVVLGPTADGGYWCLGLNRSVDARALLERIDWSSGREAGQTLGRAEALRYRLALADGWDDVDHVADLQRLMGRLAGSGSREDRQLLAGLAAAGITGAAQRPVEP